MHVAGEAQLRQVVDEGRPEHALPAQPLQFGRGETQAFQVVQGLLQAGGDVEVAAGRQLAGEELEHRRVEHAVLEIALQHGQLVQVGEQDPGRGKAWWLVGHGASSPLGSFLNAARTPAGGFDHYQTEAPGA
ncbi:hypothetical protein D3C81_1810320 [compost metagenome]